jgi:hypothetical protein
MGLISCWTTTHPDTRYALTQALRWKGDTTGSVENPRLQL